MKRKSIAVTLIIVLVCGILGNMVACSPTSTTGYDLTIASTAGGSVTTPGEATFTYDDAGTVVYLEAEAQEGYYFVNWSGDVSTIANVNVPTTIITMNGDYEITANFEQIPIGHFALTITSTAGGSVTVPGEGAFICTPGMMVVLEAEADEGYRFTSWTGDVSTIGNVTATATTITVDDNYSITANFVALYDLTIASTDGGSVTTPGEETYTYDEGAVIDLVAEAEDGYRFDTWTGDVGTVANISAAATTITMNDNYSITANFVAVYDLTIASTAWGSVTTPGEGTFPYDEGTAVDLVAEADEGCQFAEWTGDVDTIADVNAATTNITMSGNYSITANFQYIFMVAGGYYRTVGLKSDGTVVAVGRNDNGQCNVNGWTGIVHIAAGTDHTVGLKADGTAVAVGLNDEGECDISGWTDITQVAAGYEHTVGLKSDGTVIAVGLNNKGQCDIDGWTDITQVVAGLRHTVGLKSDGTVVATGDNYYGQCNVDYWTNITQVAAFYQHTVGLKSDGTVIAVGNNMFGQCNVAGWTGITQVASGGHHTVGVKSDGTAVAVGLNDYGQCDIGGWTNIIQVTAGFMHTVGLKSDGTAVAVGLNDYGQCDIGGWDLT